MPREVIAIVARALQTIKEPQLNVLSRMTIADAAKEITNMTWKVTPLNVSVAPDRDHEDMFAVYLSKPTKTGELKFAVRNNLTREVADGVAAHLQSFLDED